MARKRTLLSRRTVLRGLGATVALPLLDVMTPSVLGKAVAATGATKAPTRMAYIFAPNGMIMPHWTPGQEGALADLPATLQPLNKLKDQLLVLSHDALHRPVRALRVGGQRIETQSLDQQVRPQRHGRVHVLSAARVGAVAIGVVVTPNVQPELLGV